MNEDLKYFYDKWSSIKLDKFAWLKCIEEAANMMLYYKVSDQICEGFCDLLHQLEQKARFDQIEIEQMEINRFGGAR